MNMFWQPISGKGSFLVKPLQHQILRKGEKYTRIVRVKCISVNPLNVKKKKRETSQPSIRWAFQVLQLSLHTSEIFTHTNNHQGKPINQKSTLQS